MNEQRKTQRGRPFRVWAAALLTAEHGIYLTLGAALAVTAVMALAGTIVTLLVTIGQGAAAWEGGGALFVIIDRLLFVLMMAEILYTVRVSLGSGSLVCEPFLIVGLIACIRRILVITLQYSQASHTMTASWPPFRNSMIELGLLGALILVMVSAIYALRRSDRLLRTTPDGNS